VLIAVLATILVFVLFWTRFWAAHGTVLLGAGEDVTTARRRQQILVSVMFRAAHGTVLLGARKDVTTARRREQILGLHCIADLGCIVFRPFLGRGLR
jgi:hypothetical protein